MLGDDDDDTSGKACGEDWGTTTALTRAAFVLVTETVGAAFLITGSLKCTLSERVVREFVLDARGRGAGCTSCMAGERASRTW